jgi:hypothetical protein
LHELNRVPVEFVQFWLSSLGALSWFFSGGYLLIYELPRGCA